jgi:hypothetical protein
MESKSDPGGKLICKNKRCGKEFQVRDFKPNTGIRCDHCGQTNQYRTTDFIRQNYPKD